MDWKQLALLLGASFILVAVVLLVSAAATGSGVKPLISRCVGVIDVKGEISTSGGAASSAEMLSQIDEASKDGSIAAILLDIESPGGSAVASKDVFDAVRELKKPVVAYIGEVGASGGYYIAAGAGHVVANPNAITGSIGARASLLNYEGLFGKIGLREESIKSGELKDMGSGSRNLTEKEREIFGEMINETFENFEHDVRLAREGKLKGEFENVIDGRILTARQALNAGLVDEIGSRKIAVKKAAQLGNLPVAEGELPAECAFARPKGLRDLLASFSSEAAQAFARELGITPGAMGSRVRLEYS